MGVNNFSFLKTISTNKKLLIKIININNLDLLYDEFSKKNYQNIDPEKNFDKILTKYQ